MRGGTGVGSGGDGLAFVCEMTPAGDLQRAAQMREDVATVRDRPRAAAAEEDVPEPPRLRCASGDGGGNRHLNVCMQQPQGTAAAKAAAEQLDNGGGGNLEPETAPATSSIEHGSLRCRRPSASTPENAEALSPAPVATARQSPVAATSETTATTAAVAAVSCASSPVAAGGNIFAAFAFGVARGNRALGASTTPSAARAATTTAATAARQRQTVERKQAPPPKLARQEKKRSSLAAGQHQQQQLVPLAKRQRAREYTARSAAGGSKSNARGGDRYAGGGNDETEGSSGPCSGLAANGSSAKCTAKGGAKDGAGTRCSPADYGPECAAKWRSMAEPGLALEATMYQVFVAMMLHKRAREVVVRAALCTMRALCRAAAGGGGASGGGGGGGSHSGGGSVSDSGGSDASSAEQQLPAPQLTCAAIAAMPQSTLADAISSVHFNNVKARHLREASQMLLLRHGGRVPSSHFSLLELPGIGEKMAGLLCHVRKAVAAAMATASTAEGTAGGARVI